ncbi:hypothetical protein HYPSUDRAFT_43242 [Hypholoma sublateritium FD-334 SS-4]|uniref:F-box domain-containing protein n=1 Tax=Hypholoma sublateritium (strain FD-334 SS-4) TaxID=945553 RepID=A0A0D2NUX1_HYPSF|nr:hypothetical protein HYPSUDRAFT_43242 [Hypholoma sublateritium FD-334 SS-4]
MATNRADSTLDLPLEVAELIIDESALAGDKDTLRNICLASKRYTPRCQQHLFHTIDLGDRCIPGGLYYRRLRTLLVRFPELGKLVRELRLVDTYVWDSEKEANWGWLIVEENLAGILAALPNLSAFSLRFNAETPAWPSFAAPLRHALIQLAQRPTMHAFALNRIARFPPSLLVTLVAGVRELELIDVAVQEFSPAAPLEVLLGVAAIATPVVVSLTLRAPKAGMLHVLRTILAAAPLPTLRRLRVAAVDHTDGAAALELWSLLHWGAHTITQIEWLPAVRPLTPATSPPAPIDFAILTRLASLQFLVNFHAPAPVFRHLLPVLAQVASGSHFHRLVIECMFVRPMELVARQRDWAALDGVLGTSAFHGVRDVVFVARKRSPPAALGDAAVVIGEMLPLARSRGVRISFDRNLD